MHSTQCAAYGVHIVKVSTPKLKKLVYGCDSYMTLWYENFI